MPASFAILYVVVGGLLALLWLPPAPWRPPAASSSADDLVALGGATWGARVLRRGLVVLLAVLLWPVYWRARVHRGRGVGPGSKIPPGVDGGGP